MYELQYVIATAVGLLSFVFAIGLYRWHNEVEIFAAISFIAWSVLTVQSDTLVVLDETGATHTFGSGALQLLAAGLALVSLLALFGALTGRWPTEEPV